MSTKPKTHQGDLEHLPVALEPLTKTNRWVVWSWEERTNKDGSTYWTKPPFDARSPQVYARNNDPTTWSSYPDAVMAVGAGNADGIGFMLLGSGIGAGDLDHAKNATTGVIDPWAQKLTAEANGAYVETTVSGAGLRVIGKATGPELQRKFVFDRKTRAGIELYRNTARYITISGLEIGSCAELPLVDDFIDTVFARFNGATPPPPSSSGGINFNTAGPQQSSIAGDYYEDLIRNGAPAGGNRSDLFQAVVWHLAGRGRSINEIVDELAKYPNGIGQKYANRLHREVTRSYNKWLAQKCAATGGTSKGSPSTSWPPIYIRSGEMPRVVNEAEAALISLNCGIYQRGGLVVRPAILPLKASDDRSTHVWSLVRVETLYLAENLARAARFFRFNSKVKDFVLVDAPEKVADTYLSRRGEWKLPVLAGIATAPFLRADGSICEQSGYDEVTGILFKPEDQTFPPIPQFPTKDDAVKALAQIDQLIDTFPFVKEGNQKDSESVSRSVMLSAIFTALDRRSMSTAPLHAFTAPTLGSGKSLLVDIVAALTTGQPAPVISQGRTEEELEKRLGAALIQGDAIISIDNCEYPLQSAFLCQVLTQQRLNIRLLGKSQHVEVPANAALFATGNNLVIAGDLIRRVLLCSIDPRCERPEQREFSADPISLIQADRGALVAAALTVLRAWHVSNEKVDVSPFGSFDEWSYRVRNPLLWLERADPCDSISEVRKTDPERSTLSTVMAQWEANLGFGGVHTVREVIGIAVTNADFHDALLAVAADKTARTVSNDRLGRWLRKIENKIVDQMTLGQVGNSSGYPTWSLTRILKA